MDRTIEKSLINDWLKCNSLGHCKGFRARISTNACMELQIKNKKRLDNFEYDSELMGFFLKFCVYECKGLNFT